MEILLALLIGALIGRKARFSAAATSKLDRAAFIVVAGLLFVLGSTIGQDSALFTRLPEFGLTSLTVAWACVVGSSAVALIAHRLFGQSGE